MATKQYDDELEDDDIVVPNKSTKNTKHQDEDEEDEPKSKKSTKPTVIDEDEDVDFGNEDLMKNPGFLERLEVKEKGIFARFTILSEVKPKKAYSHYVEGKGSFRCFTDHASRIVAMSFCEPRS